MASDHVNGNGTEEPMDTSSTATHSENFEALLQAGLPQKVAEKLDEIYIAGERTPSSHTGSTRSSLLSKFKTQNSKGGVSEE